MGLRIVCLLVIAASWVAVGSIGFTQDPEASCEELRANVAEIANQIGNFQFEKGATTWFSKYDPDPSNERENSDSFIKMIRGKADPILIAFGQPLDETTLIREELGGTSYCRLTYASRHEYGTMIYQYTFYRGEDRWVMAGFNSEAGDKFFQVVSDVESLDAEPVAIANAIVQDIASDRVIEAIDAIKKLAIPSMRAHWKEGIAEQLALTLKLEALKGNSPLHQIELLKAETAGPDLVRLHWVDRRKQRGVNMQLTFCKTKEGWRAQTWNITAETPPVLVARELKSDSTRR